MKSARELRNGSYSYVASWLYGYQSYDMDSVNAHTMINWHILARPEELLKLFSGLETTSKLGSATERSIREACLGLLDQ